LRRAAGPTLRSRATICRSTWRTHRSVDGRRNLTPTEYDILRTLVQHAGKVLTHRQLLRTVWGPAYEGETHLLRVNVSTLRRKIEKDPVKPRHVITEPGVGYRLRVA
jgi:two-component system KDP operon response regulator KdpE